MFGIRQVMTGRCNCCGTWNAWGNEKCHGCHARLHPWRLPLTVTVGVLALIILVSAA